MPRSAAHNRKKIYALFNSSQPATTATCCDREYSIFQVQVLANSFRLLGRETLCLCIFFLGKQAEKITKDCILKFRLAV